MPLGPLRRFGPGGQLGEWPSRGREPDVSPLDVAYLPEDYYSNWLQEIQAHMYFPWATDRRFMQGDQITLGASASLSVVTTFTLPPGHIGVWYQWAQNTALAGDFANITWVLTVQGQTVEDHSSIIGQVSTLLVPEWLYIPIPQRGSVAVLASNGTAVAIAGVGARIRGWHWPAKGKR